MRLAITENNDVPAFQQPCSVVLPCFLVLVRKISELLKKKKEQDLLRVNEPQFHVRKD